MHWRGRDLKIVLAWALASTVLATSALWVIRAEEQRQLGRSAEHSALQWAQFAEHTLPDLEEFRPGSVLQPAVRQQLLQLTHFKDIFLYKIHDKAGDQVLASSDLKLDAGAPLPVYRDSIGSSYGSGKTAKIRNLVMSGKSYVELKQGLGTDRPAVYSEAFVPVVKGGVVQGVVEVYVDQTELAASTRASFARVVALVGGFLLLFMGIGFYQSWLRLRSVRKSRAKYQELAHADPLTGSMNRVSFNLELHAAVKHFREGGPPFALVCIDLDNFKEINDTLGHAAGDQALREAMHRITESVRAGDFVARLGGDEFAVLLMNVEKRAVVASMAHRLLQRLGEPLSIGSILFNFGGSAGIVMHGPEVKGAEDLLAKADLALYRAKETARGYFTFYDAEMDVKLQLRRELVRDLGVAIESGQLAVHYQPLYESDAHTLVGYEALLRWQHPTRGLISPVEFIGLAEEYGLIGKIGQWVLRQACRDAVSWPASLTVQVNISPAQFADTKLVAYITETLQESGLPAKRLGLEITESLLVNNTEQVSRVLNELTQAGIGLAMDDFGTGYSSLAYLWRFPFAKVKIDRAFTSNLDSNAKVSVIVRSIISMAHALDIRVNAEGVETESQINLLRTMGCDELQGFGLGKPLPNDELTHDGHVSALQMDEQMRPRESLFVGLDIEFPSSRTGGL